jgi:Protein of unknown function (DUF3455)
MSVGHVILVLTSVVSAPNSGGGGVPAVIRWHAEGVQIYSCGIAHGGYDWRLIRPEATLTDSRGVTQGHHGAGPSWTANDGSRIVGLPVTQIPAPEARAIPWLVLRVETQKGEGVLRGTTYVLRTDTVGGTPSTGCDAAHAGAEIRVPYQATYSFLHSANLANAPLARPSSR